MLKVNNSQNYNTYEGANKSKFLEKYLFGNNETGEITMLNYVKHINTSASSNRRFEAMDMILENPNQTKSLELQGDLNKLVSKTK